MRNQILELVDGWDSYRSKKTTNKLSPIHQLILHELPKTLSTWATVSEKYIYKGSDGQGNILRTPWIATFNPEITSSATKGFYPVYLFRDNLQELVLEIGFGATQFEEKYGRGPVFFEEITRAVVGMQTASKHLLKVVEPSVKKRLSLDPTILDSSKDFKLRAYEKCSIYSLTYSLANLPSDELLRSDYREILKLYDAMADSLILPSEEAYVLEDFKTPKVPEDLEFQTFVPGKKKNVQVGQPSQTKQKRYSKTADKVGKIGEEFIYLAEKTRLLKLGKSDLAEKVIWHRNFAENRTPGWDITSFNDDGSHRYIEVKSSSGKTISSIFLTSNEWIQALNNISNDSYQIYLVSKVLTKPEVKILVNPAKWVQDNKLELEVETYSLGLNQDSD